MLKGEKSHSTTWLMQLSIRFSPMPVSLVIVNGVDVVFGLSYDQKTSFALFSGQTPTENCCVL